MAIPAAIAKAAATLLTNEKTRKGVGWVLVAVFSPVILLIALLCSIGSGGAEHNNASVEACFYGSTLSAEIPGEFRHSIEEMRSAFSLLDSAVVSANEQTESGNGLDPLRVKAVFYALCFGEDAPTQSEAYNTIASDMKLSRSTVKRALHDLEQHGYLKKAPRHRANGSSTSNLYTIR